MGKTLTAGECGVSWVQLKADGTANVHVIGGGDGVGTVTLLGVPVVGVAAGRPEEVAPGAGIDFWVKWNDRA